MLRYISALPGPDWQCRFPRALAILGSTGSIGQSALAVVRLQPERFRIVALAAGRNIDRLAQQAAEFRPDCLCVLEEQHVDRLRAMLPSGYAPDICWGQPGYEHIARMPEATTVLSAQVGAAGLRATCAAAEAGKVIALANKESLVLAGHIIRKLCARTGASILPVDSEHNAIFQCLTGNFTIKNDARTAAQARGTAQSDAVRRLILTASGGPFYGMSREELAAVTPEQALTHPNWDMGAKITIDSATLMNKGLEIIEAAHLYGLPLSAISVLVHRESIIHSLVEFRDGSQLAQLGQPDMRIPIAHCLGWPQRLDTGVQPLDLAALGSLSFAQPDEQRFPCLALAKQALEVGKGSTVVLSGANEVAVAAFLAKRVDFSAIDRVVARCMESFAAGKFAAAKGDSEPETVEAVLALDAETRGWADRYCASC